MEIDFVVAWVDGNDEQWRMKKARYSGEMSVSNSAGGASRYRDWDIFRYWFRSIEINAPWVHRVYLITDHQVPEYLNEKNSKLCIVNHDDYIPNDYLPTFNANPIEINFHRIQDLSEYFVYFNDDMFLNKPVLPTDFFRNNKPCYELIERPLVPMTPVGMIQHICLNDMGVVNKHYRRNIMLRRPHMFVHPIYGKSAIKNLLMLPFRHYQKFQDNHMPCPFLKSTLQEIWDKEYAVCDKTSRQRFRTCEDINQYVFKYWDLARGNFAPYHFEGGYYCVSEENYQELINDIEDSAHMMICVNDSENLSENMFLTIKEKIIEAFVKKYPQKCSFEI